MIDTPATFVGLLDGFLAGLPAGFRFGVEIRNPEFLGEAYFDTLASHNVAHVFNAWTRMPDLETQVELPGAFTADFTVSRALLTRGRAYEECRRTLRALHPGSESPTPRPEKRSESSRHGMLLPAAARPSCSSITGSKATPPAPSRPRPKDSTPEPRTLPELDANENGACSSMVRARPHGL